MKVVLAAAFLVSLLLPGTAAAAATLTVRVQNIDPKGGTLRVSLYTESAWSKAEDDPSVSANVPARTPETVVRLTGIAPGIYGVKMYQDANNNEKFDQKFIGLPLERFGFSRDARPLFSEPGFERTRFAIKDGDNEITIQLQ